MNSKSNNNQSQNYVARKPCCKVCKDAGKQESVYTSHYVKDKSGRVTCPTLLSQECRYCFKSGHTLKFCPILKEKQEHQGNPSSISRPISKPIVVQKKEIKKSNVFAYLDFNSDESDSEPESTQVEEFPTLSTSKPATATALVQIQNKFSYASIASKPKPQVEQIIEKKAIVIPVAIEKMKKCRWVDAESSDEEESDEEEYQEKNTSVYQPQYEDNSAW